MRLVFVDFLGTVLLSYNGPKGSFAASYPPENDDWLFLLILVVQTQLSRSLGKERHLIRYTVDTHGHCIEREVYERTNSQRCVYQVVQPVLMRTLQEGVVGIRMSKSANQFKCMVFKAEFILREVLLRIFYRSLGGGNRRPYTLNVQLSMYR